MVSSRGGARVFLRIPWNTQDFGEKNKYISVYMYSLYYLIRKKTHETTSGPVAHKK
jgi:hypothetical protein